jgi:hypothetical protein
LHRSVGTNPRGCVLLRLERIGEAFSSGAPNDPKFKANTGGIPNPTLPSIDLDLQLIRYLARLAHATRRSH